MIVAALGANATTTVYYQNTGVPVYIQHGAGPRVSIHSIQSNPHMSRSRYRNNFARPYGYNRYARDRFAHVRGGNRDIYPPVGNQEVIVGSLPPKPVVVPPTQISRFDKGYKPRVQKSYSRGGMVYYN